MVRDDRRTFRDEYEGAIAPTVLTVISKDTIQDFVEDEDVVRSLLVAATLTESLLVKELQRYFEVHTIAFDELGLGKYGLGWYLNMCKENDLIEDEHQESLQDLTEKRNKLVHDFGYLSTLEQDKDERDEVQFILESCAEWFETKISG